MPNKKRYKYDEESLRKAVAESVSIAGVLRKIGVQVVSGGMHAHIKKRIEAFNIDTSHFLGARTNSGINHVGGFKKLTAKDVLIINTDGYKTRSSILRRALVEAGVPFKCTSCGLGDNWNGLPLKLEVEHKNGNSLDNRLENLEFLCPNCHSQTSTYCMPKKRGNDGTVYMGVLKAPAKA